MSSHLLAKGCTCSYKLFSDGTRQIVDFQVPGDILGSRSVLFRTAHHFIQAVSDVEVSEVKDTELKTAFGVTPRLAMAALWGAARDEAMVVEHLVRLGDFLDFDGLVDLAGFDSDYLDQHVRLLI